MSHKFTAVTLNEADGIRVKLQGELDLAAAGEFRTMMEPLAVDPSTRLTLDLSELSYIDSTGIGILISILKVRHAEQAPFFVENVPPHVQKLFDVTGISKFLIPQR
ncbi:STAS domain-containing protein [Paenibacillus assamensis]|uniref:STAS domain-containing protein n=1 Tax=Paenibacillus assamensis TaxID=311244 RepID=UPI00041449F1|nr:STAS domain-containing protein [Paenibacillus assamensis]